MKKVSFDFDGTLEFQDIQEYAKELVNRGVEVWIVTTRYEDLSNYNNFNVSHTDLYKALEYTGIKKEHVHFNNMEYKYTFFKDKSFAFHLDDNPDELRYLRYNCPDVKGVYVLKNGWKEYCEELLSSDETT